MWSHSTGGHSAFRFLLIGFLILTVISGSRVMAGDWPQLLGPNRNGIAVDEKIVDVIPGGGLKTLWQQDVGDGFAGVSIVGDRAVVFHRIGDEEVAECRNAATGKLIWKAAFPTEYAPSFTSDAGPRCNAVIHDGRVYLYGARGDLHCVSLDSGKTVWERDLYEDYSSKRPSRGEPPEGYFGFGSSPIVEGDRLLLNVGGRANDAGIVAFDLATGRTLWNATEAGASYSSPVAATIGGQRHVIFVTRLEVISVDPASGRKLFSFDFGRTGPSATGANPVVLGDHLFVTGSYNFGAVYSRIGNVAAVEVWSSDEVLSSQYTTSIVVDGLLYGIHGRQDSAPAAVRCIDPATRRVLWEEPGFGYATMILADGKLLIVKTDGELVLARPNRSKFDEIGRTQLLSGTARALPALSSGRLYVRNESTLKCVDVSRP